MMSSQRQEWTVEDFDLMQLVYYDVNGTPRGKTIPKDVARKSLQDGIEFIQVLQVVGLAADFPMKVKELMEGFTNGMFVPDLDTLVKWPWACKPGRMVGQVIGHIIQEDGRPDPIAIRNQLDNQVRKLKTMGYTIQSSFSIQFTVFKRANDVCGEFLGPDSLLGVAPYDSIGVEDCMLDVCQELMDAGIEVESWSSLPSKGAYEMTLVSTEGTASADAACRFKHGIKSAMAQRGFEATFMTHPSGAGDKAFSTMIHRFSLHSALGQNVFMDEADEDKLSGIARHWISGLLGHGAAMTALCCPTVNCYSRFNHDVTFPKRLDWEIDDATACLSVRLNGRDVWIENRLPTAACNPFCVLLATLAAGLEGIEKEMTCPQKSDSGAALVPQSLGSALDSLKSDGLFREAVSSVLLRAFINVKDDYEVAKFNALEDDADKAEKFIKLENEYFLLRL
ncbi:unnamed protein product [Lymnaea stagnalis]|uniref:Lengsin n=1 Tax=Lymnaea stagnalis TaxID=6523 RepID=A0AAV2ILM8_LYMST